MVVPFGLTDAPPVAEDDEPARPAAPLAVGGPVAVGDGSSSRDRLARIAAMIRDAERAGAVSGRPRADTHAARLVPLGPRPRGRLRRRAAVTVADLAS